MKIFNLLIYLVDESFYFFSIIYRLPEVVLALF